VLGLIAGLTIPSIVVSVDKSKNRTILREALQTIATITQTGVLNGDFANITDWDIVNSTAPTGIVGYITSKLNYSKQCLTADITSEGCRRGWIAQPPTSVRNAHNARWILPNGCKVQALEPAEFTSSLMLWTVTSKAYADDQTFWGNNPDTTITACNITETPQVYNGNTVKAGMCGAWDAAAWTTQLNTIILGES
jgi:type II secretory pathway pseudopilin PulG